MNKKDWWIILAVVIVVAILTSLITLGVTGNVIRVNSVSAGAYQVYTKAEVDKLITGIGQNISNRFKNCGPTMSLASSDTGNNACLKQSQSCVFGYIYMRYLVNITPTNEGTLIPGHYRLINCDETMEYYFNMYDPAQNGTKIDIDPGWLCC